MNFVSSEFKDIDWTYDKKNELDKTMFDISDSIVCCLGKINMWEFGEINPEIINVIETDKTITYDVKIWDKIFKHEISFI